MMDLKWERGNTLALLMKLSGRENEGTESNDGFDKVEREDTIFGNVNFNKSLM